MKLSKLYFRSSKNFNLIKELLSEVKSGTVEANHLILIASDYGGYFADKIRISRKYLLTYGNYDVNGMAFQSICNEFRIKIVSLKKDSLFD